MIVVVKVVITVTGGDDSTCESNRLSICFHVCLFVSALCSVVCAVFVSHRQGTELQ